MIECLKPYKTMAVLIYILYSAIFHHLFYIYLLLGIILFISNLFIAWEILCGFCVYSLQVWKRFTHFEQTYGDLASMLKVVVIKFKFSWRWIFLSSSMHHALSFPLKSRVSILVFYVFVIIIIIIIIVIVVVIIAIIFFCYY